MATTTTETAGTTETTEHAAKPGMPQLDTTTWTPQLFWLAICFIALYMVISKIAIPGVGGAIRARKSQIDNDLAAAQKLKADTDQAIKSYEAALAEARAKSNAIAQENRDRLQAETDAQSAKTSAELSEKTAKAEAGIAAAKKKAMAEVESVAADLAGQIMSQLTGSRITKADLAKAVKSAR
jgi:F-type H+-transporting ATPase subunit b